MESLYVGVANARYLGVANWRGENGAVAKFGLNNWRGVKSLEKKSWRTRVVP